jgi:hypothetical protein
MKQGITCTRNYGMFTFSKSNRPHSPGKHKQLESALVRNGYDPARPIVCWRTPAGALEIVDGQHRFYICREHGIPICYTVTEQRSARDFNSTTVGWSMGDYIASHVAEGNKALVELDAFQRKYGVPATIAEMLLAGRVGNAHGKTIKEGTVQITDRAFAEMVGSVIVGVCKVFKHAREMLFITAIARFCRVPQFNIGKMIGQINAYPGELNRQATLDQYAIMLESIYNRNAKGNRVPIRFLADEEMRKRNRANRRNVIA